MQSHFGKGVLFALCAAALNATIGVLSKVLMNSGFTASTIALIKTVLGCLLLSALLLFLKRPLHTAKWIHAAVCAFLGIFVLFHFETSAYGHYAAAGVVVILMASASISSILLGRLILKDPITANATVGAGLTIAGIAVIFGADLEQGFTLQGAVLAAIGGCGYGAFSVAMKRMGVSGGATFYSATLVFRQPLPADASCERWVHRGRAVAGGSHGTAGAGRVADHPRLLLYHQGHRVPETLASPGTGADRTAVCHTAGVRGAQ